MAIPEGVQGDVHESAREALVAAKKASTESRWTGGEVVYDYDVPLAAIRDAVVASGQATLAVASELSATRAEIREVAEAVRELTTTLSSALGEVGARVTDAEQILSEDIAEMRDEVATQVAELRTGVAEASVQEVAALRDIAGRLAELVQQVDLAQRMDRDRPRRWWRRRRAEDGEGASE